MKTRVTSLLCYALLSAAYGCGPMDPPMAWKTSQIRSPDQLGPGIAVRTLEAEIWGRTEYSDPAVVVTAANGITWEIWANGQDPSKWGAYRIEPGKEPVEIPFGPMCVEQTHLKVTADK